MKNFSIFYNKHYKKLLVVSVGILILSIIYLGVFYYQTGDIINKDVSLTGGTTIIIQSQASSIELEAFLKSNFTDLTISALSDNTGKQTHLMVTVKETPDKIKSSLENYFGYKLTEENSTIEFSEESLSKGFYKQLIVAIILAFFWMSAVVFLIFGPTKKLKFLVILLNLILGVFITTLFSNSIFIGLIFVFILLLVIVYLYIKYSIPSFAVILSAFTDITVTLAIVNFIGMRLSTAGIVAFLMLIGYSVDTDCMLVTRMLRKKPTDSSNKILLKSFKTGLTMTITSMFALIAALIAIYKQGSVLNQIFIILIIGLCLDIFSTWVSNASIIKWYVEKNKK